MGGSVAAWRRTSKLLANLQHGTYTEAPVMHIGAWKVYASVYDLFSVLFSLPFPVSCFAVATTISFVFSNGNNIVMEAQQRKEFECRKCQITAGCISHVISAVAQNKVSH